MILVWGGSGSGKSAWAERMLLSEAAAVPDSRAVYLATMERSSPEAAARIERHRAMRSRHGAETGRAFVTVEQTVDIGGAAVLWLLSACGYVAQTGDSAIGALMQPQAAINCLWALMSFIPACVALIAAIAMYFYPLTTEKVSTIAEELRIRRNNPAADVADNFNDING